MDTKVHDSDPTHRPVAVVPLSRPILIYLELLAAMAALYGGIGLIADNALGITEEWLQGTPFNSWVLPGVFLLVVVAAPMLAAAAAEVTERTWAYGASMLAGAAEVSWILAQWMIIREFFFLQPIMLAVGVAVMALAHRAHGRIAR
jgi:hypothetical protein